MLDISIIVPAYNEEKILHKNFSVIYDGISKKFPHRCKFIIVDSNSTDKTAFIAKKLAKKYRNTSYVNVNCNGKGGKISYVVGKCKTPYIGWIDSDLPLEVNEYCKLINEVISNSVDIAIASRYIKGSKTQRKLLRLVLSRVYHYLVRSLFLISVYDSHMGAKFWNPKITKGIWPLVKGKNWFFDTELVYHTIKKGYKLVEVPVTFRDRNDSRFNLIKDSLRIGYEMLKFRIKTLISK